MADSQIQTIAKKPVTQTVISQHVQGQMGLKSVQIEQEIETSKPLKKESSVIADFFNKYYCEIAIGMGGALAVSAGVLYFDSIAIQLKDAGACMQNYFRSNGDKLDEITKKLHVIEEKVDKMPSGSGIASTVFNSALNIALSYAAYSLLPKVDVPTQTINSLTPVTSGSRSSSSSSTSTASPVPASDSTVSSMFPISEGSKYIDDLLAGTLEGPGVVEEIVQSE